MDSNYEFLKVKEAFLRVKKDMDLMNLRIEKLEKENTELRVAFYNSNNSILQKTKKEDNLYIGHLGTKKIHRQNCPYAKNMNPENRVIFDEIGDALREKYVRCNCVSLS